MDHISRRAFIKSTIGFLLYSVTSPVQAQEFMFNEAISENEIDKYFGGNSWVDDFVDGTPPIIQPSVLPEPGQLVERPELNGCVPMRWSNSNEAYQFNFRTGQEYNLETFAQVNWFLRCRGDNNASITMDYRLIECLNYISHSFGGKIVNIHSGYRTPAYNRRLKEKNHKVAQSSYHIAGRAIDFSIEGVSIRDACSVARGYRDSVGFGGLGYYPKDGFIHIDTGPMRQWVS